MASYMLHPHPGQRGNLLLQAPVNTSLIKTRKQGAPSLFTLENTKRYFFLGPVV